MPPAPPSQAESSGESDKDDIRNNAMSDILKSIARLRAQRLINEEQAASLEELVFNESLLIYAVYSVAISANDGTYFANICKDIALTLESEDGRLACSAQEEILEICDQLYKAGHINSNQLLYLRHLILIRAESVAVIYDEYQANDDAQKMANSLYHLIQNGVASSNKAQTAESSDDDSQYSGDVSENPENMRPTLLEIVKLMVGRGRLNHTEASALMDMINARNEYVYAAFELFQQDNNVAELQDTLKRCATLELRQRANNSVRAGAKSDEDDEDDYDDDDEDDDDDDEDDDDDDVEPVDDRIYKSSVDHVLNNLGVRNVWDNSVPNRFILVVFEAVQHRLFTLRQGRVLCDLFQSKYDMVLATWEVYKVQNDVNDLTDSLRRIVREFDVDASDNDQDTGDAEDVEDTDEDSVDAPVAPEPSAYQQQQQQRAKLDANDAESKRQQEIESRRSAMESIMKAKIDLLKHSLEVLVKQKVATEAQAISLFERALKGDPLVEAAIESYSEDRDVTNFLNTLKILCNFTPEQIQEFVREETSKSSSQPSTNHNQQTANDQSDLRQIITEMDRSSLINKEGISLILLTHNVHIH